jgi:site-specific DNA recombinase
MRENARQGFSNGSRPPFGYAAVEAERRGEKIKKKLAICEPEAVIVRRIFDLYRGIEGLQYGVKAIASKLNTEGVGFRGKAFMISNIHRILTAETYTGRHYFNVFDSKSGSTRSQAEWIAVDVPSIIQRKTWEVVQAQLAERAPRKTAARIVNSPTLLTGIATCAHCGAAMNDLPSAAGEVITFVREWRPVRDSNSCPRRERATTGVPERPALILTYCFI